MRSFKYKKSKNKSNLFLIFAVAAFLIFFILLLFYGIVLLNPSFIFAEDSKISQDSLESSYLSETSDNLSDSSDIIIKKTYTDKFPNIVVHIDFKEGSQIGSAEIKSEDIKITEDGRKVEEIKIERVDTITEPIGVVLLIDKSGSMKGQPIEDAKNAAILFMDQMRKIDKFCVVGFSDTVKVYSTFTKDRDQLKNSILQIISEGETSLFDGISIAIDQFKNQDIRYKYIIVLSDGRDTVSKLKPEDDVTKAKGENVTIYSIALLSPDYNPIDLRNISENTKGELLIAASSSQLRELYNDISRKIRNQYKISYISSWPNLETIDADIYIEKAGIKDSTRISYKNPYFVSPPTKIITTYTPDYLKFLDIWWVRLIMYFGIFSCVVLLLYVIISIVFKPKPVLKKKTEIYGSKAPVNVLMEEEVVGRKTKKGGFFGKIIGVTEKVASKRGFVEFFDLKLERAGLKIRGSEFMTIHILVIIIVGILLQFFLRNVIVTSCSVLVILILPFLYINLLTSQRIRRFDEQLPDTLQLISGALKSGYSFNQSLSMVIEETKPPISEEFTRVLNGIRMGLPEHEALENSSNRIGSEHYTWVVMAIHVQREAGGNLAEIMEIIASTIRERARVMNQIKALTAEGRLSAIILIALPIILGLILFMINREYISLLYTTRVGYVMLGVSALLMIVGIFWIIKIIRVKY